jgi:hypothetical protein
LTERCFVKVEFDPATSPGGVRNMVGGFLRYIQHRDLHPRPALERVTADVAGLVKYVAFRDKASSRAELFGPKGALGTPGRRQFVEFVTHSIAGSSPQLFRTRTGELMDRRRAVSRFLLSPEDASGLDLHLLARAAVVAIAGDMGVGRLQWIAAIHRNTPHHHVHLVIAGMYQVEGGYRRLDIPKRRLAAIKEAIGLEIERQRRERMPERTAVRTDANDATGRDTGPLPALPAARSALIRVLPAAPPAPVAVGSRPARTPFHAPTYASVSLLRLRSVARRYQRQMEREAQEEAWRLGREWAA